MADSQRKQNELILILVIIATWNINGINSRLEHVVKWSLKNEPDVLCLQETKTVDARFPVKKLLAAGYEHVEYFGEKAYNGVAILSRHPIESAERNFSNDNPTSARRIIAATINGVRIVNVYAPHGTELLTEKYHAKLAWFDRLRKYFVDSHSADDAVILCGDLNVAPHELDVWSVSAWKDKMHFTKPERDAIQELKKWGFVDLFRLLNDEAREFSWWGYYEYSFRKDQGLRIDHVWGSRSMADACVDCWIDKEPRSWENSSDHTPVVAEFRGF